MFGKPHRQVLVVGAGPVGLCAALALRQQHVQVEIIDEEWKVGAHSYGLALHPASLSVLEDLGLLPELLALGRRVECLGFYEGAERRAEIHLAQTGARHPYLLIVPQQALEDLLAQHLEQAGVRVHWDHRLASLYPHDASVLAAIDEMGKESSGYATATTEWVTEATRGLTAEYVIGADGHNSKVRRLLEISNQATAATQFFAVFECQASGVPDEARIMLDAQTANVCWPLAGDPADQGTDAGRCRWSFEFLGGEIPQESRLKSRLALQVGSQIYPYLTRENLAHYVAERASWFAGQLGPISWSLAVRFERSLVSSFGRGRVFLAGDAAHLAGPVGMQSFNSGLQEAAALSGVITHCLADPAAHTELEEYAGHYQNLWRHISGADAKLQPLPDASPWVSQNRDRLLACLPAANLRDLNALAGQLHLRLEPVGAAVLAE
jgi:2-polyprenyl-6-methoxyphenol hydroxylase-like FAD-dependent oxidoreductase